MKSQIYSLKDGGTYRNVYNRTQRTAQLYISDTLLLWKSKGLKQYLHVFKQPITFCICYGDSLTANSNKYCVFTLIIAFCFTF